jgi:hypothetical protein
MPGLTGESGAGRPSVDRSEIVEGENGIRDEQIVETGVARQSRVQDKAPRRTAARYKRRVGHTHRTRAIRGSHTPALRQT